MKNHIPNIFTLFNLFFGCIAIVFALQTESVIMNLNNEYVSSFDLPERLSWAAIFIALAAVVDFLDGFIARLFKATSELGKQLDSLSDIVSFGVAPGVILYQLLRFSFAREENGLDTSILWLLPAFVLTCAAGYRLAKFNLDDSQTYHFKGLPTPAVGLLVASFPLIIHTNPTIGAILINKEVLYGIIIVLSFLMVSNLPLMSLKFRDYTLKSNLPKVILLVIGVLCSIFLGWAAVPFIFIAYILLSLLFKNKL